MVKKVLLMVLSLMMISAGYIQAGEKDENWLTGVFQYRNLGAFRAGSWISDIAVPLTATGKHKYTIYVAARNGGVWKTVNNGTTFFPVFDQYGVNSIGAVEVAPSNPDIVWVGTGDDSNARSAYYGNGIYKSVDGGGTFTNMGLKDSHHIGKIMIHPTNPDIVYAAVMGHLFSPNKQRGVFKTADGGKTWTKVLYINDKIGVADLVMNPQNPDILFAATYDKHRYPWHYEAGGKDSRIYRTENGGKTWEKLTRGLPEGNLGRIGIDIHRSNPDILYTVIQNLNKKPGIKKKTKVKFDEFTDHSYDDLVGGEVYRSDDGGDSWRKVSNPGVDVSGKAAYSFNEISVDPKDPQKVYIIGVYMQYSLDGGKTWPRGRQCKLFRRNFGDVRTFWINPENPEHMMLGSDGGFYVSWDGGRTTDHFYNIPLGEIYAVEVDNAVPYNIYAGLQDHEVWKGPSNHWSGSVGLENWVIVGLWDGMYSKVNPRDNRWLYFTSQFGKHHRLDQLKGERVEITPRAAKGKPFYRYTWTTPLVLSPHNGDILYTGGQMLLRSLNRGDTWEEISPDLTYNDPVKIAGKGHMMYCTITTISESPVKPGVIWVGTDDGRVHSTREHGAIWHEHTRAIHKAGGPKHLWVSRVFASHFSESTAYVTKTGYRNDIFKPYIFRTRNFGKTWENISANLPPSPVSVILEDKHNPELLFIGNDLGVYFTLDGGKNWHPFKNNMPPVPVRDLCVQDREGDLVVGTYGRGVWITHIAPLQELSQKLLNQSFYLFNIKDKPVSYTSRRAWWGNYLMTGDAHLRTPNQRGGLSVYYYLKEKLPQPLKMEIIDIECKTVKTLKLKNRPGIHKINWVTRDYRPGRFRFVLSNGVKRMAKSAILLPPLKNPVGNPDHYR